jgi:hypothetical protein
VCEPGANQSITINRTLGTGFYILVDEEGSPSQWLVTARHVVEAPIDLLAKAQGGKAKKAAYMILPHDKWIFHPEKTPTGAFPIDVAVMRVLVPIPDYVISFKYCPGQCTKAQTAETQSENQLGSTAEPTDRALFFGYPEDVVAGEMPPFARSGIVAYSGTHPQLRIEGRPYADDSVFYIDAHAFEGNSGGPVVSEPNLLGPSLRVLGLVTGTNEKRNYTIATSVSRIKETLDHAIKQISTPQKSWSVTPPPPLPVLPCKQANP